ncbi:MAG: hypothetical protein HYY96_17560, partial [Candidatus Tectomicrobia bacterium]|nr:hypothetical protein [Candidatus Tectomicrobia bacterium]
FVPLYQTFFSHRDRQGATRASGQVFKTAAGLPGLAMRPVQPHSITRLARDCTDCHSSGKALGLGDGYQEAAPGARVPPPISQGPSAYGDRSLYLAGTSPTPASEQPPADPPLRLPPLDKLVDQTGKQLLDLVPSGARPFQRDEIDRLLMVSDCAACHGDGLSPAPPSLSTEAGGSFSTRHRQSIERLFERALGAPAANAQ